ncbi:putative KH domain-containing protein [Neospora caninum Liverpool]|uniref:KH domain-containing protein, putative n=1 Tax=Neospora caninum (strain Liverpool) TaxID=572307 RepID=F0V836_NEOCL|nr:putative KH domain-containing protein [Neospora caninum Liverpool]CBZ49877.1 putative KH domain-containing protein [Neospora caninum Liverpool]CEL64466.1 TPA: KH domain-containing protein, putative [Neospora caninum Liverpool]|eukprot:XP_003879912.1 putative KH domain-containing protein [Neospora caninum Liverpool]
MDLTAETAGTPPDLAAERKEAFSHADDGPCYDTDDEAHCAVAGSRSREQEERTPDTRRRASACAADEPESEQRSREEESARPGKVETADERDEARSGPDGEEDGVSCSASNADLLKEDGREGDFDLDEAEPEAREPVRAKRKRGREGQGEDIFATCPEALVEELPDGSKIRSALQRPVLGVLVGDTYSIKVSNEDAAFIIGRGGSTKKKIAAVSGSRVELEDNGLRLDVTGTEEQRERALLYIRLIMQQRLGPVRWDSERNDMCTEGVARLFPPQEDEERDEKKPPRKDLTVLAIPSEAVAYVTGSNGQVLRRIEDEWRTLMFFTQQERGAGKGSAVQTSGKRRNSCASEGTGEDAEAAKDANGKRREETDASSPGGKMEELLIFGSERSRVGASLKVMSAVDQKLRGFYTRRLTAALAARGAGKREGDRNPEDVEMEMPRAEGKEEHAMEESEEHAMEEKEDEKEEEKDEKEEEKDHLEEEMQSTVNGGEGEAGRNGSEGDVFGETLLTTTLENICAPDQSFWDTLKGVDLEEQDSTLILVDIIKIDSCHFSYCLGREGKTRRKLASAAGCMLEYIGHFAFAAGTLAERRRVQEYLSWLVLQREKPIFLSEVCKDGERSDLTVMDIPREKAPHVAGRQGNALRDVEERTGTFCFFEGRRGGKPGPVSASPNELRKKERLLIFGTSGEGRHQAVNLVRRLMGAAERGERGRRGEARHPCNLFFDNPYQLSSALPPFFPHDEGLLPPGPLPRRDVGMHAPFLDAPRILPGPHPRLPLPNFLPPSHMSLLGRQKLPASMPLLPGEGLGPVMGRALSPSARRTAFGEAPSLLFSPFASPGLFPYPDERGRGEALASRRERRGRVSPERASRASRYGPYASPTLRGAPRLEDSFSEEAERGRMRERHVARGAACAGDGLYGGRDGDLESHRRAASSGVPAGSRAAFLPTVLPRPFGGQRSEEIGYGAYPSGAEIDEREAGASGSKSGAKKGGYGLDRERERRAESYRQGALGSRDRHEDRRAAYLGEGEGVGAGGDWGGSGRSRGGYEDREDREKGMYSRESFAGRAEESREAYAYEARRDGRRKEERRHDEESLRRKEGERRKDERTSRRDEYLIAGPNEGSAGEGRLRQEDEAFSSRRVGAGGEGRHRFYGRDDPRDMSEGDVERARRQYSEGEFSHHKPYRHYREEAVERSREEREERASKRRATTLEDPERERRDERHHGYAAEGDNAFLLASREDRGRRGDRADPLAGDASTQPGSGNRRRDDRGAYSGERAGRDKERREEYGAAATAHELPSRRRLDEDDSLGAPGEVGSYGVAGDGQRRRSRSPGGGPYFVGYGGYSARTSTAQAPAVHAYDRGERAGGERRREREALERDGEDRRQDEDRYRASAGGRRDRAEYGGRSEEERRREEADSGVYEQRHRGYRTAREDRA